MIYLDLDGRFNLMAFSGDTSLAEFNCEADRNVILDAKEICLRDATLTCKRWSPGIGTVSSDHLKIKDRWVLLKGIPFHLWSSDVFDLVCSSFGKFQKIEVVKTKEGEESTLRAFVRDCNPKKMTNVTSLQDFGLAFPIKVSLDEAIGDEQPLHLVDQHNLKWVDEVDCVDWQVVKSKRRVRSRKVNSIDRSQPCTECHLLQHPKQARLKSVIGEKFMELQQPPSGTEQENVSNPMCCSHETPGFSSHNTFSPLINSDQESVSSTQLSVTHVTDSLASSNKPSWSISASALSTGKEYYETKLDDVGVV